MAMSPEELVEMTPFTIRGGEYVNLAAEAARNLFITHVKNQPATRSIFFSSNPHDSKEGQIHTGFDFNKFATAYVSKAISMTNGYGFAAAINVGAVDSYLKSVYESTEWIALGFELYSLTFPDDVKRGNHTFRNYVDHDREEWGKKLSDVVSTDPWMNNHVERYIHNQWPHYNEDVNVILFKVHLLNESLVDKTFDELKKGIPKITNEFSTTTYLGVPLNAGDILGIVQKEIGKSTSSSYTPPVLPIPGGGATFPITQTTTRWGANVAAYITSQSKNYGFYSGKHPDNSKTSHSKPCTIL